MHVESRPQAEHAIRWQHPIASVYGTPLAGPAVWMWLEGGGVPLAELLLRFVSDVLCEQRGAQPREAKMSKNMTFTFTGSHVFTKGCQVLVTPDNQTIKSIPIPYHIASLPYHIRKQSKKW